MNQLSPGEFERVLHYLLSDCGMDVDDALEWIDANFEVSA